MLEKVGGLCVCACMRVPACGVGWVTPVTVSRDRRATGDHSKTGPGNET